jgi:hypothetical protein
VNPQDTIIYFASGRSDQGAQGGADVWRATRKAAMGQFDAPARVAEVSSVGDDQPSFVTRDDCTLYMWSTRAGGQDLYVASRPK